MKLIQINNSLSTGLSNEFQHATTVEIEDDPFAEGGFGAVYHCITINGVKPSVPQVIKIFTGEEQEVKKNILTVERLQQKLQGFCQNFLPAGKALTDEFPGFKGIPQFSFLGTLGAKKVCGFSANNLVKLGFIEFNSVWQDKSLQKEFYSASVGKRMIMASHLAKAFSVLEELNYIHADLKTEALFINLEKGECAIIDYDSGAVFESSNDEPTTWGAPNDWVAPEIWEQQKNAKKGDVIKVDLFTDRWSVVVGIHYLILGVHPLFYLNELSPRAISSYKSSFEWPDINSSSPFFNQRNAKVYDAIRPFIEKKIPDALKEIFSRAINYGYSNKMSRPKYKEWVDVLLALQQPPEIKYFTASRQGLLFGMSSELSWEVEGADTVSISNNIGEVKKAGKVEVRPESNTVYHIKATNDFGNTSMDLAIRMFPTPVMKALFVPAPEFKIASPSFSFSGIKELRTEKIVFKESIQFPKEELALKTKLPEFRHTQKVVELKQPPKISMAGKMIKSFQNRISTIHGNIRELLLEKEG